MSAKHTPGPWFQGTGDHQYCVYDKKVWINPDGSRGGDTPNIVVVVSPADALADARLIAAAPELLEALEVLEAYVANNIVTDYPTGIDTEGTAFQRARAAIAKATGSAA